MPFKFGRIPKYRNKRTIANGISFASKGEASRFLDLQILERAGRITKLLRQVRFSLDFNDVKIGTYVADATYYDEYGRYVVEDFKGTLTPDAKIKLKAMKARYGFDVALVNRKGQVWTVWNYPRPKRRKKAAA